MRGSRAQQNEHDGGCTAPREDIVGLDDIVEKAKDLAADAADEAKKIASGAKDVAGDVAD